MNWRWIYGLLALMAIFTALVPWATEAAWHWYTDMTLFGCAGILTFMCVTGKQG